MNAGILAPGYAAPLSPRPLLGLPQPVPTPYQIGPTVDPFWNNVSLLMRMDGPHGSKSFSDLSPVRHTVTANGDVVTTRQRSIVNPGSAEFDGNEDWLSLASSPAIQFGTGNFTLEMWMNVSSLASQRGLMDFRPLNSNGSYIYWAIKTTGAMFMWVNADQIVSSAGSIVTNTWYHVALCRAGTSTRMFINGRQAGSTWSDSTNYALPALRMGRSAFTSFPEAFVGVMDEIRITKGVARYISNFAPPTAPFPVGPTTTVRRNADPFFSSVSLLLRMDGQNGATSFPDLSNNALVATVSGNTQTSTADSPFGGASGLFDGTADFLQYSDTTPFDLTGNFTIEFWMKTTSTKSYATVYCRRSSAGAGNIVAVTINNGSTGVVGLDVGGSITQLTTSSGINISDGQWHHVAATRSGNTFTVFVDGVSRGSSTYNPGTISFAASVPTQIGRDRFYTARDFDGRLAEFRITRGVARYSGNFTTPTSPFPGY